MSTVPQPLSFKFFARFSDGTKIIQTDADESAIQAGKSAFFDVQEKHKESPLQSFRLIGDNKIYGVNLRSGRFTVNGVWFSPLEQDEVLTDLQLIYFREVLQHNTMSEGTLPPFVARYFLGYKGKDENGKVVKKLINFEA